MKYMLQIRFNGADAVISKLPINEQEAIFAEFRAIGQLSGVLDGNQLQDTDTATTVRVHNGQTHLTEGPAVESGSALDGYYLYDAPDLEAAIALAARIPATQLGATVEVRPVVAQ